MTNQVTEPRTNAIYIEQFNTIRRRHAQIEENSVEFLFSEARRSLGTIGHGVCFQLGRSQYFLNQLAEDRVIIYNKNLLGTLISGRAYCKIHWFGLSMNWKP